jgi:hypothetical protein
VVETIKDGAVIAGSSYFRSCDGSRQLYLRRWDETGAVVEDKTY